MAFDPSQPLRVVVSLDSPHLIKFKLVYRGPADSEWTEFAGGKDDSSAKSSKHDYEIGVLPPGSIFGYSFNFAGQPQTAYRAVITLIQVQQQITESISIDGITDNKGTAHEEKEITLS
jgi:hypothetical protein